ncbi:MAG: MarR family transcriptional regulator [Bacteroidota bacterium]
MDAIEIVISTLKNSGAPMKAGEIAETAGIDKKDVEKAIKKLRAEEKVISPKNCFYCLK